MNQKQLKNFILKLNHDLAGQRRCLDLVNVLLHEGSASLDDAKRLLVETIVQFDLAQKTISSVEIGSFEETKPKRVISQNKEA
ncbi:MAG: hypothetical protein ACOYOK_00210 [Pseudobdellovibrionaceae bacterium]